MTATETTRRSTKGALWPVWLAGMLFVVSQVHLAWLLAPLSPSIMVEQLCFTPDALRAVWAQWGPQGLALYRTHFGYDMVHPLLYGAFGWLLVARMQWGAGLARWHGALQWALPVAAACDVLENFAQLALLDRWPVLDAALVAASATFSAVKWSLVLWFAVMLAWRLLCLLRCGRRFV